MEHSVDKVLLVPRFTCFAGAGPWHTAPMSTREYSLADLTVWVGPGVGTPSSSAKVVVQVSTDLEEWFGLPVWLANYPTGPAELTWSYELSLEWLRLEVTGSGGSKPVVTLWSVGDFVRRERR
jgi:hypothetical protein